jgi:phage recombination protein Bet
MNRVHRVQEPSQHRQTSTAAAPQTALARIPRLLQPYTKTWGLNEDQVDLIKRVCLPRDATNDQMALYFHECQRRGVHPMDRSIIMLLFKDKHAGTPKPVFVRTIDYLNAVAEESGESGGADDPVYGPTKRAGDFEYPEWAKVKVYRVVHGRKRGFIGVARWKEFYPGSGDRGALWRDKPFHMLAKCARAQALRIAFPKKLDKAYIREEMDQAVAREVVEAPLVDDAGAQARPVKGAKPRTMRPRKSKGGKSDAEQPPVAEAELVDDFLPAEGNPDHWRVVADIKEGEHKKLKKLLYMAECENGRRERRKFYTFRRAFADSLRVMHRDNRVFELESHKNGVIDEIDEITPL